MLESKVWPVMREAKPKGVTAYRIETGRTALGVADVLWFAGDKAGWCEIKTAERIDGRVRLREEVKAEQAAFLEAAALAGCAAHVAVLWLESTKECGYLVIDGRQAKKLVGLRSLPMAVEEWTQCDASGHAGTARAACRIIWRVITGWQV